MTKAALRKIYRVKRKALSPNEISQFSERIFENFINCFDLKDSQKIHIFLSVSKLQEVETVGFINYCFQRNISVFVPKMINDNLISVEIFPETELEINSYGISEPRTNADSGEKFFDYIITPLLYCDEFGNRVGYGKGFYDRLFAQVDENSLKVGVNFFPPDEIIENADKHDVPLDYLVTPDEVFSFGTL